MQINRSLRIQLHETNWRVCSRRGEIGLLVSSYTFTYFNSCPTVPGKAKKFNYGWVLNFKVANLIVDILDVYEWDLVELKGSFADLGPKPTWVLSSDCDHQFKDPKFY